MKKYSIQFREAGDLKSFETRGYIDLESDNLIQLLSQFSLELAKMYDNKIIEAVIKTRQELEPDELRDDDIPF